MRYYFFDHDRLLGMWSTAIPKLFIAVAFTAFGKSLFSYVKSMQYNKLQSPVLYYQKLGESK